MKTRKILRILLLVGIMIAVSFNAEAQFGNFGKKLKNKVEKTVKESADKTTDKAKDNATDAVGGKLSESTGVGSHSYSGWKSAIGTFPEFAMTCKASAEAQPAAPQPGAAPILPGYTKSFGDIPAPYGNLSDKR